MQAFPSPPGPTAPPDSTRCATVRTAAVIVRTCGSEPVVYGVDGFIAPRQALLTSGTLVDFRKCGNCLGAPSCSAISPTGSAATQGGRAGRDIVHCGGDAPAHLDRRLEGRDHPDPLHGGPSPFPAPSRARAARSARGLPVVRPAGGHPKRPRVPPRPIYPGMPSPKGMSAGLTALGRTWPGTSSCPETRDDRAPACHPRRQAREQRRTVCGGTNGAGAEHAGVCRRADGRRPTVPRPGIRPLPSWRRSQATSSYPGLLVYSSAGHGPVERH